MGEVLRLYAAFKLLASRPGCINGDWDGDVALRFLVGGDSRVAPNDAVLQAQVRVGGETSREKESC